MGYRTGISSLPNENTSYSFSYNTRRPLKFPVVLLAKYDNIISLEGFRVNKTRTLEWHVHLPHGVWEELHQNKFLTFCKKETSHKGKGVTSLWFWLHWSTMFTIFVILYLCWQIYKVAYRCTPPLSRGDYDRYVAKDNLIHCDECFLLGTTVMSILRKLT